MNKTIILLCLVVLFCSSSAKTLDDTQTKLTVIGMPNPPFSYREKDGNISGITVEKIKSILDDTNYSYEFSLTPWPKPLEILKAGKNTLIFPLARTAERENDFTWVTPVRTIRMFLISRSGNPFENLPKNPFEIIKNKNYNYGCFSNSYQCSLFKEHGADPSQIIRLKNTDFARQVQRLTQREFDFIIADKNTLDTYIKEYNINDKSLLAITPIGETRVTYLVGNKNLDPNIVTTIRNALQKQENNKPPISLVSNSESFEINFYDGDKDKGIKPSPLFTLFSKIDWPFNIQRVPYPRSVRMAEENPNTLFFPLIRTKEREDKFFWFLPIQKYQSSLIGFDNENYPKEYKNVDDIIQKSNYSIGCLNKSVYCQILEDIGLPDDRIKKVSSNNYQQLIQMMERKRFDFYIANFENLSTYLTKNKILSKGLKQFGPIGNELVTYLVGNKNLDPRIKSQILNSLK